MKTIRVVFVNQGRNPRIRRLENSEFVFENLIGSAVHSVAFYTGVTVVCAINPTDEQRKFTTDIFTPNHRVSLHLYGGFIVCGNDIHGKLTDLPESEIKRHMEELHK
jgi:hypothetical protein